MKVKTSELSDAGLDWAVAIAQGIAPYLNKAWADGRTYKYAVFNPDAGVFEPSRSWSQGGRIIEREKIELKYLGYDCPPYWGALKFSPSSYERKGETGPTPLIAAMRCYVASKFGDEVDIPDELVKEN